MARLVAIVAGALALAGCQIVPASSPDRSDAGAGFVRHPNGIEVPAPLAPEMDRTPQPSGLLRVQAAVPAEGGAVLGIGSYPAGPAEDAILGEAPVLLRREPGGSVRELARLPRHGFRYPNPDSPNIWPG